MEAKIFDRTDYSEEEYFELFDQFERKIEYHAGRIQMMAGASGAHNEISMNLTLGLGKNPGNCKPHSADWAVKIPKFNRYVYPDLSFTCKPPEYEGKNRRFLINPALLIEVISGSSNDRDRNSKFDWYFSIPSVREYIVINSQKFEVKSFLRKDKKDWYMQSLWEEDQILTITSLKTSISLGDIYRNVVLASGEGDL